MTVVLPACEKCHGELYRDPEITGQKCSYPPVQFTICKDCGNKKWTHLVFLEPPKPFKGFATGISITNKEWIDNLKKVY